MANDISRYEWALEQARKARNGDGDYPRWLRETAEAEKFNIPDPSVYGNQADLFRKLSWVALAIDLLASTAAIAKFSVSRVINDKEPKDIPNHPFELLMQRPNPMDSRFEFLYATFAYWGLSGNSYWWLNKPAPEAPPEEMWIIPSNKIKPVPDENLYLKGYYYYPGTGAEIFLQPWEIVHFKRYNPNNPFIGLSAIEAIALVAAGDLGMQQWNTRLFAENNARLPGIIAFKDFIQDTEWSKIKSEIRESAKKRDHMMLRGVGDAVTWLQNASTQKDMEFLASREANQKEIMTVIAPGSYSMLSENSTEANSRTGKAVLSDYVYTRQVMMAEKITNDVLPLYSGRPLVGAFEDIRIADKDMTLREQEAYERTHTAKEVRLKYYKDGPLGDERDDLLPSQITAAKTQEETETNQPSANDEKKVDASLPAQDPEPNEDEKAMKADLAKWERKAVKKPGQAVLFESDAIPAGIKLKVERGLRGCKSGEDVRSFFAALDARSFGYVDETQMLMSLLETGIKAHMESK